jgi:predicted nucleotidyltransferase
MNIKISKEEHEYLNEHLIESFVIGSHLYGTQNENSDMDVLCIYDNEHLMSISPEICNYLPNYHQFQYDDTENNKQYIWTSKEQFFKNLFSGDSTINADVIMFYESLHNRLQICRTYKVIKAFIGFANRDLKDIKKKNKLFHAHRSLYCASMLLRNELPTLEDIKHIAEQPYDVAFLREWNKNLRELCNELYEKGHLEMYCIPAMPKSLTPQNKLLNSLVYANNTKEFKYD